MTNKNDKIINCKWFFKRQGITDKLNNTAGHSERWNNKTNEAPSLTNHCSLRPGYYPLTRTGVRAKRDVTFPFSTVKEQREMSHSLTPL